MNEINDMREALDRAEQNLERMRWIIANPLAAMQALQIALNKGGPYAHGMRVVEEIDRARNRS